MSDAVSSTRLGTVLVVAGEFPPLKTIGRIRTTKFVEHLFALGWEPVVLTLEATGNEPNYDKTLNAEIPLGVEVVRIPLVTFDEKIIRFIKRILGRPIESPDKPGPASKPTDTDQSGMQQEQSPGLFEMLQQMAKRWIRYGLEIPDSYLPWALKAAKEANAICRRRKVDVVFTTLPPFSAAYVGYRVRGTTGVPWVADYRDLWYGDVLREWLPKWRTKLELLIEKRLLQRADVIVTVSEQKTNYMRRVHPNLKPRWETLTNGYDSDIYTGRERTRPFTRGRVEFVYTGRLFKNRRGYAFAEALGRIKHSNPQLVEPIRVRILGGVSPEIAARYDEIIKQYDIGEHFEFAGDVSYQEAMDAQVNCDYLLLIVDTGETSDGVIPGKLFEYVAARRPIFALCDPGATQQIVERARLGLVAGAEDAPACERELRQLLQNPVPRKLERDDAYLARFDRKAITSELSQLLAETIGRR